MTCDHEFVETSAFAGKFCSWCGIDYDDWLAERSGRGQDHG